MKGISFNNQMVLAILRGDKTVTRRIRHDGKPRYKSGEVVAMREALVRGEWVTYPEGAAYYEADEEPREALWDVDNPIHWCWKRNHLPAMFLPDGLVRCWLQIKDSRIERLSCIKSERDGFKREGFADNVEMVALWDRLHKKPGERWTDNPLVERVEFEVRRKKP